MRVRSVFPFILALVVAGVAHAGPVTGHVVDPDGRAVANARVWIAGTTAPVQTTTDALGWFTLMAPDECRCEVRAAAEGFRAAPVTFEATSAPRDIGAITLTVSAVSESLVVSATQVEIPLSQASSSITVITGEDLRERQVTTVADALRAVPGLTVLRSGSAGALTSVFPRGGESDYTLVYVDDVQVNAFGGGMDFAHLSSTDIDRIEIVRGPQSALYGSNAIGAVVRIITRSGGPARGDASIEGGSFGTTRLSASSSGTAADWFWGAGVDRLDSDGFNGERSAAGDTITNDDYSRTQVNGSGGWRAATGASVHAQLMFGRDDRGFPGPFGSNPIGAFTGIDTVARGSNDRWGASIAGTAPSGARVRTRGELTWSSIDSDFVSSFGNSRSGSRRLTARGQADIAGARGIDFSTGAEFQRERGTSSYITDNRGETPIERYVVGIFGEGRFSAADRFFATAGVRVENIHRDPIGALDDPFSPRPAMDADTVVSVNPRISAAFRARTISGSETKLRGSFGTGIRPPDAFELAFTDNPALKPERSRTIELGIEQAFAAGHASVDAAWFHNTFDDLIVAVGRFVESSRYRTDNISNARAKGVELGITGRHQLAGRTGTSHGELQVRASYTFLDTEILAVDNSGGAPAPFTVGQSLINRPRHQWAIDAGLSHGRVTGWLRGGGRGEVLAVEPSYGTFGGLFDAVGYNVWNAGASWRLAKQLELFGRIENLFDRRYEEVYGFPALGRGAFAGVRVLSPAR